MKVDCSNPKDTHFNIKIKLSILKSLLIFGINEISFNHMILYWALIWKIFNNYQRLDAQRMVCSLINLRYRWMDRFALAVSE